MASASVCVTDSGVPFGDRDLGGDKGGGPSAPILDDLEEIAALVGSHGRDRPVVEDQEPNLGERGEQSRVATVGTGDGEVLERSRRPGVEDRVIVAGSAVAEGAGEPGLSRSGRAGDDQVDVVGDPSAFGQLEDEGTIEAARGPEVDVLDRGLNGSLA